MNDYSEMNEERMDYSAGAAVNAEDRQNDYQEWRAQASPQEPEKRAPVPWLGSEEINGFQSRWKDIQTRFVDEPYESVKLADTLVSDALDRIEVIFSDHRKLVGGKTDNRAEPSTEELRIELQNYRAFLNRLLAL